MKCVMVPVILFFLVAAVPAQITSLNFTCLLFHGTINYHNLIQEREG